MEKKKGTIRNLNDPGARKAIWQAAIGLQDVDGLSVSPYLIETAEEHIDGIIDLQDAKERIESHYAKNTDRTDTKEADLVSVRIAFLLSEESFSLIPEELKRIHEQLFRGIYDHAGNFRTVDITKKEWVLEGDTVLYCPASLIQASLDWDFSEEKKFSYDTAAEIAAEHIASFIKGLWQTHPFREGNTRTIAVFLIKYLRASGFTPDIGVFAENSWYFRNALVRANYMNYEKNVIRSSYYLSLFMENLLFGGTHELKNRAMHIKYGNPDNIRN